MRFALAVAALVASVSLGTARVFAVEEIVPAEQVAAAPSAEGTEWTITLTPDAAAQAKGTQAGPDILSFKDGQLTSSECVKKGFSAAPYTSTAAANGWAFQSQQASAQEGTTAWTGEASGDTIQGTMIWTSPSGEVSNFTFEGSKNAPSAS
jgi:hypothetical protein